MFALQFEFQIAIFPEFHFPHIQILVLSFLSQWIQVLANTIMDDNVGLSNHFWEITSLSTSA